MVIAITIAIENLIRINHDPILIAESDPDLSGKSIYGGFLQTEKPVKDDEKRLF